jgi:predicted RNase H-related nuclease YkuK (DUF458 family)
MEFVDKCKEAIQTASASSSFYIGCDSSVSRQKDGRKTAHYVVVFIVHMNSANGARIIHHDYTLPEYGNLKQRLQNEANFAFGLALEVLEELNGRQLEVHLDINPNPKHKSNVAVKEVLSYARGLGLNAKIKPDSFAASHAADHLT